MNDPTGAARLEDMVSASTPGSTYEDLLQETDDPSYRIAQVKRPVTVCGGRVVPLRDSLGEAQPPHVRCGLALQNVVQLLDMRDVLVDPLSFSVFRVEPAVEASRAGRQKAADETLRPYVEVLDHAALAATRSYQNYYHWLVESMPRGMRLARDSTVRPMLSYKAKLPFHAVATVFPDADIGATPVDEVVLVRSLATTTLTTNFMPSMKLSKHTLPSEDVLLFPQAVNAGLVGRPRRLFISRRDVRTRVLNDEAALVRELEKRGFDCPVMSELGLREQAELCANAEIIVSTHGAGLSNMLFRRGACRVVEIVPVRRWPQNNLVCMYNISQVAGFEHYLYDCRYPSEETRLLSQNWTIDHREFLGFLDTLL